MIEEISRHHHVGGSCFVEDIGDGGDAQAKTRSGGEFIGMRKVTKENLRYGTLRYVLTKPTRVRLSLTRLIR